MPKIGSFKIRDYIAKRIALVILITFGFCFPTTSHTEDTKSISVTFVLVKNEGIYKKIVELTEQSLLSKEVSIDKTIIEVNNDSNTTLPTQGKIISIGTKAAAFAYQQYPNQPIISALLTRSGFLKIAQDSFGGSDQAIAQNITPLFIDQPISRFFSLGSLLVPDAKTIGVLVGPSNKDQIDNIKAHAAALHLNINIALLKPDANPIKIIEPVMRNSDFFVVLPDRKHINQLAAKWTLPLSYRYHKPLISYSQKYVQAGAIASVFTSPENIATTIVSQLLQPESNKTTLFSISVNNSVARSLRIKLESPDAYQQQLRSDEAANR